MRAHSTTRLFRSLLVICFVFLNLLPARSKAGTLTLVGGESDGIWAGFPPILTGTLYTYGVPNLHNGLLAYWHLAETSGTRYDSAPPQWGWVDYLPYHGHDLSMTGTVPTTKGPFGDPCAAFRQSGFLINTGLTPLVTGTQMTVSLWARLREGNTGGIPLALQWASGGWLVLDSTAGVLRAGFGHDGIDHILTPISTNEWHHITCSWDGNQIRVTLDGIAYTLDQYLMPEIPPWVSNFSAPFLLGAYGASDDFSLSANADICDVGLWTRALSSVETDLLYNWGMGNIYPFSGIIFQSFPIKAEYSGVFTYPLSSTGASGYIRLSRGTNQRFTGKFYFGGSATSFKGSFDGQSHASVDFNTRSTGSVHLDLQQVNRFGVSKLTGTASGWYFAPTPVVLTETDVVDKNDSSPDAGVYLVSLAPAGSGTNGLSVVGAGTLRVDDKAKTKLVVTMVDGTKVTATGKLTQEESWPFYNSLYSNHGSLGGTVSFDQATGTCTGSLYWYKPTTKSKTYPGAVSAILTLSGTKQ